MKRPPFNLMQENSGGDFHLKAFPGYEHDVLIVEGHASAGALVRLRFNREGRAWLRAWLDEVDRSRCAACGKPRDLALSLMCDACIRAGVPIPEVNT